MELFIVSIFATRVPVDQLFTVPKRDRSKNYIAFQSLPEYHMAVFHHTTLMPRDICAASTNSKSVIPDQSHSTTFTSASSSPAASSNIRKLDLEELDIKWQMAMLSVRINRFEKKAGRKMKFNNKDAVRETVRLLKHDHEGEDVENGAAQVYGMIVGAEDDAAGSATGDATGDVADDVSNAAAEFALMGISSQDLEHTFGSEEVFDPPLPLRRSLTHPLRMFQRNTLSDRFFKAVVTSPRLRTMALHPLSETADQQPSSTNDDSSFSFKENVKPPRNLCNKSEINSLAIITKCIWMREDGELLLSPQQVVLGEFKGQICNRDPRTMENPHKNRDLGIVDSGCSRSMTGNKEKLDDFVQIVGGTVTFGGGDGKITGKGTIRTSKLNFENVYYVAELQNFNLFSLSQICDTKNKVLFTDKECLVLSKEFQLPKNSQVVLKVPRRNNITPCVFKSLTMSINVLFIFSIVLICL
ncbi:hypothetical protein Tco_1555655 [Tanacetum coccineum]